MANAVEKFCADFYRNPVEGRLLMILGNSGTGKTHCSKAVFLWARHVCQSIAYKIRSGSIFSPFILMRTWASFLDNLKNGNWNLVEDFENADLLIIDDVGSGHDPSRIGADKLCRIMSSREKKWTLITSNLTPSEFEEAFDRRVSSRMARNSTVIVIDEAKDYSML